MRLTKRTSSKGIALLLLGLFLCNLSFMALMHSLNFNGDNSYFKDDQHSKIPQQQGEDPLVNETFSGYGDSLDFSLAVSGEGYTDNPINITELALSGQNISVYNLALPNSSIVTDINLTLSELERINRSTYIINDSVYYLPTYELDYTLNAYIPDGEKNWLNITCYNTTENEGIESFNISIDGVFNQTLNGTGPHNVDLNLTGQDIFLITIESFYQNKTLLTSQNITTSRSLIFPHLDYYIPPNTGNVVNDFIRINETVSNFLAFKFSIPENRDITSLNVFGKYNFLQSQAFSINFGIYDSDILGNPDSLLGSMNFNGGDLLIQPLPDWINLPFSTPITLTGGDDYFLVVNNTDLINSDDEVYFDLYLTNNETDSSQDAREFNIWGVPLNMNPQKAALFNLIVDEYIAQDLTEIRVSSSISNQTLFPNEKSFDPITNQTIYDLDDDYGPWGTGLEQSSLPITFTTNYSCRFKLNFSLNIIQTNNSDSITNFTALFREDIVHWSGVVQAYTPTHVNASNLDFDDQTMRYNISIPDSWIDYNATAPTTNFSVGINHQIEINSSVSSLEWAVVGHSPTASPQVSTFPDNRTEFSESMDIQIQTISSSLAHNISLSFWNLTYDNLNLSTGRAVNTSQYMNYTVNKHTNISIYDLFENFTVPSGYNNSLLTARIWWHNTTDAGITMINFAIKDYSSLENFTGNLEILPNQTAIAQYQYQDEFGEPILNANISIDNAEWDSNNWSYSYADGIYSIEFIGYKTSGSNSIVNVNFSHNDYIYQNSSLEIYILIKSSLTLLEGKQNIVFNETLLLKFGWYASDGSRICFSASDPALNITAHLDGVPINNVPGATQYRYDASIEYPNANIEIELHTAAFADQDYLGDHNIGISVMKVNDTDRFQPQNYIFYFSVSAIPTYLNFVDSSAAEMNVKTGYLVQLNEYENTDQLTIQLHYQYNASYTANPNDVVDFDFGSIEASLVDKSNGITVLSGLFAQSLFDGFENQGRYELLIPLDSLNVGKDYDLTISAQGNNLLDSIKKIRINILPQWNVIIALEDTTEIREGKPLPIVGTMHFDNSTQFPAQNKTVNITLTYFGDGGILTESYLVNTDMQGNFHLDGITAPDYRLYDNVNISITYPGQRENMAASTTIKVLIQQDPIKRIVIPIIIILLIIFLGIPIVMRFIYPWARKNIPETALYQKIEQNPAVTKIREKYNYLSEHDQQKQPEILRIPNPDKDLHGDSTSCVDTCTSDYEELTLDENEEIPDEYLPFLDRFRSKFNEKIRELQEVFNQKLTETDLLSKKDDTFRKALLLEQNGIVFDAIIQYYYAQEYARRLNLEEEVVILESCINRLLVKLDSGDQIAFLRNYKMKGEKQRKAIRNLREKAQL